MFDACACGSDVDAQELATLTAENIPVKCMILNNQHLGMVVQWEDRFYKVRKNENENGRKGSLITLLPTSGKGVSIGLGLIDTSINIRQCS
eukprot:1264916-Pyramimonas_sp.AAC.1